MFKHNYLFFAILTILFFSCQRLETIDEGSEVEYKLSVSGELGDIFYTAITKSYDEKDRVLAINVYQESNNSYDLYATGFFAKGYGGFDDADFSIKLQKGIRYKFCASYTYQTPGYDADYPIDPAFRYAPSGPLNLRTSTYRTGLSLQVTYPEYERFYCEEIVEVSDEASTLIVLNMKRCAAKFSITCDNLLYGRIRAVMHFKDSFLSDGGAYEKKIIEITPENKTAEITFSLKDATLCWKDEFYYDEYHQVDFYYGTDAQETLIKSVNVPFHRNTITHVPITLTGGIGTGDPIVGFTLESDYKYQSIPLDFLD